MIVVFIQRLPHSLIRVVFSLMPQYFFSTSSDETDEAASSDQIIFKRVPVDVWKSVELSDDHHA